MHSLAEPDSITDAMTTTLVERYEGQRRYWERNAALVSTAYYERELPKLFTLAERDPDAALGGLTALCASLLELAKENDPANGVEKEQR